MLAASRDLVVADVLQGARSIRYLELENVIQRYTSIIGVMSLCGGFAFSAMVELEIDSESLDTFQGIFAHGFYIAASAALALAMYSVALGSYVVAMGYRLAMIGGESGSVDRAVFTLRAKMPKVFGAALGSGFSTLFAAASVVYIKIDEYSVSVPTTFIFIVAFLAMSAELYSTSVQMHLGPDETVEDGKVRLPGRGGKYVDLGNIELPSSLERAGLNAEGRRGLA